MAGYVPQPIPIPQYAPQPQYQPPPAQQYQPQPQPQQFYPNQQPAPQEEDAFSATVKRNMKKLNRKMAEAAERAAAEELGESAHRMQRGGNGQVPATMMVMDESEVDTDAYADVDTRELEKMLARTPKGSKEYDIIAEELEQRELEDELGDLDELGEPVDELTFSSIYVWNHMDKEWVLAFQRASFDSAQDMLDQLRDKYSWATKIKWGKVSKGQRELKEFRNQVRRIRSDSEIGAKTPEVLGRQAPPLVQLPPNVSQDTQLIVTALTSVQNQNETARAADRKMMMDMMEKMNRPASNPFEQMAQMKAIMVDPIIEMIKVQHAGKGGGGFNPSDAISMTNAILGGAKQIAGLNGGGNSGGGGGVLDKIMEMVLPAIAEAVARAQMKDQGPQQHQLQQQRSQMALPNRQQTREVSVEERKIRSTIAAKMQELIAAMVGKRLSLEQVPRAMYRNLPPEVGGYILRMPTDGFLQLLRASAGNSSIVRSYIDRQDTKLAAIWIHEEFRRLAVVINSLNSNGRKDDIPRMLDWNAGELIPTNLIGKDAEEEFKNRYNDEVELDEGEHEQPASSLDLPPSEEIQHASSRQKPTQPKVQVHQRVQVQQKSVKIKDSPELE